MKKKFLSLLIVLALCLGLAIPALAADTTLVAKPTASTVLVNGQQVAFDAYNIGGNNYFKLRDLAYALNGSAKQFDVGWDGANNAISLTSSKAYTVVGGEMTGKGAGDKMPTSTSSKIYLDGKEVQLTAYNIEGNNYFKLRDIGEAFNFGVDWDGANNTIVIDTSKDYTPDTTTTPTDSNTGKTFTCTGFAWTADASVNKADGAKATVEVISSYEANFTLEFPFTKDQAWNYQITFHSNAENSSHSFGVFYKAKASSDPYFEVLEYSNDMSKDWSAEVVITNENIADYKITYSVTLPDDCPFSFDMIGEYKMNCEAGNPMGG